MSQSFSALYASQTVAGYYTAHSTTYRNPHEPGIRKCLLKTLDRLLETEGRDALIDEVDGEKTFSVLDLAGGGGEASLVAEAWAEGKLEGRRVVLGADPFTEELFERRTGWRCEKIGFREVMEGRLMDGVEGSLVVKKSEVPVRAAATVAEEKAVEGQETTDPTELHEAIQTTTSEPEAPSEATAPSPPTPAPLISLPAFTLTLISFALHLIPPTELHQTLNMLSLSSRYLIVLAPNRNHFTKINSSMGWELVSVGDTKEEPWAWVREKRDERVGAGVWRSCALG